MALPHKAKKPVNEYKLAALPEWQQQKIRADEAKARSAQVNGSKLRSFSAKRLKRLGNRTLYSTFTAKPAQKILAHKTQTKGGRVIRSVRQGLKPVGVRGKRLAPGDRLQERASHALSCVCGCNSHLMPGADGVPGKGLISRSHLESRRNESTRNDDANNLPACLRLSHWLDHETQGVQCKAELLILAKAKGKRLDLGEVRPLLDQYGYYTWVATSWRI